MFFGVGMNCINIRVKDSPQTHHLLYFQHQHTIKRNESHSKNSIFFIKSSLVGICDLIISVCIICCHFGHLISSSIERQ